MNWQQGPNPQPQQPAPQTGTGAGGGFDLGSMLGTAANIYGTQNAAEAATHGNEAAIGTQQGTMGNINSIYGQQQGLGNGAFNTLASTLGTGGGPANYSNFLNMPGYQFAVNQGTQAIQRQATTGTNGGAYSPNEQIAVGQYVTGTAMQDYNTYVNQLMGAGNFGAQANSNLGNLSFNTGQNVSQLQSNIGQNQAGGYTGGAGFIGNNSGVTNAAAGLVGKGLNYLGGLFGNGNGNTSGGGFDTMGGSTQDPNANGFVNPGFDTMGGSTTDPNAGGGYSVGDYGGSGF